MFLHVIYDCICTKVLFLQNIFFTGSGRAKGVYGVANQISGVPGHPFGSDSATAGEVKVLLKGTLGCHPKMLLAAPFFRLFKLRTSKREYFNGCESSIVK